MNKASIEIIEEFILKSISNSNFDKILIEQFVVNIQAFLCCWAFLDFIP